MQQPKGMILLGEEERIKALTALNRTLDALYQDIQRLPLTLVTLSQIRRKNDLEAKIREVEEAITIFSREKVYIAP